MDTRDGYIVSYVETPVFGYAPLRELKNLPTLRAIRKLCVCGETVVKGQAAEHLYRAKI